MGKKCSAEIRLIHVEPMYMILRKNNRHSWRLSWWCPILPRWNFNPSSRDRFHPTITWGKSIFIPARWDRFPQELIDSYWFRNGHKIMKFFKDDCLQIDITCVVKYIIEITTIYWNGHGRKVGPVLELQGLRDTQDLGNPWELRSSGPLGNPVYRLNFRT